MTDDDRTRRQGTSPGESAIGPQDDLHSPTNKTVESGRDSSNVVSADPIDVTDDQWGGEGSSPGDNYDGVVEFVAAEGDGAERTDAEADGSREGRELPPGEDHPEAREDDGRSRW